MTRFEQFNKLCTLVKLVESNLDTKNADGLDTAIANLSDKNSINFDDITLLEECLEVVGELHHKNNEGSKKEKPSNDTYVLRRLYTTVPVTIILYLTLALLMPSIFDVRVFPSNIFAALIPFVVVFVLHMIDKYYIGTEVCRVNRQGLYTADDYLECDPSIISTADFLRWKDIEMWQFKYAKSLTALYPVLYVKTKKYGDKIVCINHFHRYGLKTLRMYSQKAGKVV